MDGETLRSMITQHYNTGSLGDSFRFMQTDTAFTKLWDKGQIPTRSELIVLEEVFGTPFVESILNLRKMPEKAWELFMELWNIPRAMLASGDISASLRQGGPFIFTGKGKPWLDGMEAQLKAWKSEANALASAKRITEHPLYASSQRAGLDLTVAGTLRRAAPVTAREEPYIGARLLSRIPIYGKVVRASERAYVTMLNELRFSTFTRESEKLGAGATAAQLKDVANTVNILSGRAPLGKFAEASTILNGIFFAPRFAVSRIMAPTTVLMGSAPSRKLAAQALVSYASTVTSMLALADISGVATVEWNPLSSDFGKARFGNIRIDPWAGLQQPVVFVARLATGKTKRISTGEIKTLDAGQAIWQFLTSKLQPSARVLVKRGEGFAGEKPLAKSPIPGVPRIVYDNFVFIFAQDIMDAIVEAGPMGATVAPASILGVGVSTFRGTPADWTEEFKPYFALPTSPVEAREKRVRTRLQYRQENPEIEAKLFLAGQVSSFETGAAKLAAVRLMRQLGIGVKDVESLQPQKYEGAERIALRRYFEAQLGQGSPGPRAPAPSRSAPSQPFAPTEDWRNSDRWRGILQGAP